MPERHAVRLRRGQTLEFPVAAHPGRVFRAQVEFIDPVVQPTSRTIMVKARAPNPDRLLLPGMFIEAKLATARRVSAVVVAEDAVQPLRTVNVVWAVVDGKATRRVVQLGARAQGAVEIVSGVNAGELVVVGGLERMAEGMAVAPKPRSKAANGRSRLQNITARGRRGTRRNPQRTDCSVKRAEMLSLHETKATPQRPQRPLRPLRPLR